MNREGRPAIHKLTTFLLPCQVALGDMNELLSADYNADKLPSGKLRFHSSHTYKMLLLNFNNKRKKRTVVFSYRATCFELENE